MNKIELNSLNYNELEELVLSLGEKKFRAAQIYDWLHKKLITNLDEAQNISKDFREKLKEVSFISPFEIDEKFVSKEDGSTKYLFKIDGNNIIESVLMKYSFGNSVCISTQVGCKMGCAFCASTLGGLERNLTAGEMLMQVYQIQKDIGDRISNIVLMGSGEPLDNYDNVIKFIELINDEKGLNIGERHITLSTCGLVDRIYGMSEKKLQITLAISLHAPNDEIRKMIMPVAKKTSIDELLKACTYYANQTKRRITFEYALIENLNDTEDCAYELAKKLKHKLCHVNLIPVNEVKEKNFKKSSTFSINRFADILRDYGIETTIRRKLGSDINASCGQLRNKKLNLD